MLGILAAVKTSLSPPQLLYRYPPIARSKLTMETLKSRAHQVMGDKATESCEEQLFVKEPYRMPGIYLANLMFPSKKFSEKQLLEFEVDDTRFICNLLPVSHQAQNDEKQGEGEEKIVAVAISFVLKTNSKSILKQYRQLLIGLIEALQHLENISGYITEQVKLIIPIREHWYQQQVIHHRFVHQPPNEGSITNNSQASSNSNSIAQTPPSHEKLNETLLSTCSFVSELRDIFHSLLDNQSVNISLNGWARFSFSLQVNQAASLPTFRPYQTLLLLPSTQPIDFGCSTGLKKFIEFLEPTRSFQELQVELQIPIEQLYRFSSHLIYWKKAKIINKITLTSVYQVHLSATNPNSLLLIEFTSLFPSYRLEDCLQLFSTPKSISELLSNSNPTRNFIQIVIWLLQRELLVPIHQFIYFIPSLTLSDGECEKIIDELNDGPSNNYLLFKRLLPYFNGQNSLPEILWRENISKEKLDAVLDKYSNILLVTSHE